MPIRLRQRAQILGAFPLLLVTACFPISAPFHLYPINFAAPADPILCKLKLHFGWQTITITATLPTGGVFSGSFPTNITPPNRDLAPYWDQVFGLGFFNAKVLGSPKHFRTTLKNQQGDELQLEMHGIPADTRGGMEGVAIDSNKGIYKAGY
jgi:hypothetical protein